jgi:hypothetical protein
MRVPPFVPRISPNGDPVALPGKKLDSEIFSKFGPASFSDRRCSMRKHDFVSGGFLALIETALVLLCLCLLVVALSQPASSAYGLLQ